MVADRETRNTCKICMKAHYMNQSKQCEFDTTLGITTGTYKLGVFMSLILVFVWF
jgi:hypothetical protein